MNRRGSAEEAVVVFCIAICLSALIIFCTAQDKKDPLYIHAGDQATVIDSNIRVKVIDISGGMLVCRVDNGPGIVPRYQEFRFRRDELRKILKVEK